MCENNINKLASVAANENNPKWESMIKREKELYKSKNDFRTNFERDYTRIVYSNAYKRLKHKTQVFFSPNNDHICTRIEHVNNVESISYTIAKTLGLNIELTKAISVAHDIGHSPFGHAGEKILSEISKKEIGKTFWHEKNGVNCVDNIELLDNREGFKENLNLTYAVRDGIVSHCGEIDENSLKPRDEAIDLDDYEYPNQYAPYTWEGCVVKVSDKISYLGRDIEDAIRSKMLTDEDVRELEETLDFKSLGYEVLNNTNIINFLTNDLIENTIIENGIMFSKKGFEIINYLKKFNYEKIYAHNKLIKGIEYFKLILTTIFDVLKNAYNKDVKNIINDKGIYSAVISEFGEWLKDYCVKDVENYFENSKLKNNKIYNLNNKEEYIKAIIDYISGMTDNKAIETYNKIISF